MGERLTEGALRKGASLTIDQRAKKILNFVNSKIESRKQVKYAIILNGDKNAPHLKIYSDYFDKQGVKYDVISWDRTGDTERDEFTYYHETQFQVSTLTRFKDYFKYARFIKNLVKKYHYEKLVVISPQVALFIPFFLRNKYAGRYIFDYRDLSIEQLTPFKPIMKMVLNNSYANVISSPGFIQYLPKCYNYVLSHNFNIESVKKALEEESEPLPKGNIKVLTIGAIRFDANYEVIDSLGNVKGLEVDFVGKGGAAPVLEKYVSDKGYNNIVFKGKYEKNEENAIIKQHSCINIFYPYIPSHISALSNRFYNSLINKRPMIVSKGGEQGNYVEKYGVGLAVESCVGLADKIKEYVATLDFDVYKKNCNMLLREFVEDYNRFAKVVDDFIAS